MDVEEWIGQDGASELCADDEIDLMKKVPGCKETFDRNIEERMYQDAASELCADDEIIAAVKVREENKGSEDNINHVFLGH